LQNYDNAGGLGIAQKFNIFETKASHGRIKFNQDVLIEPHPTTRVLGEIGCD
jgi:hypothetical protein